MCMYIICQNNQHFTYFSVILFICKMRAEGITQDVFMKINIERVLFNVNSDDEVRFVLVQYA